MSSHTYLCQLSGCCACSQHQNDNLREGLPELCEDISEDGPEWAKAAFNCSPEAVNIWIGDERSVTSFHKGGWLDPKNCPYNVHSLRAVHSSCDAQSTLCDENCLQGCMSLQITMRTYMLLYEEQKCSHCFHRLVHTECTHASTQLRSITEINKGSWSSGCHLPRPISLGLLLNSQQVKVVLPHI